MSLPNIAPSVITYKREDGTKDVFICHEKIGQGGFATVYRVKHNNTNKIYAMKIISKERYIGSQGKSSLEKLKNEIQIQKSVNHPNIVQSKLSFSDESNYYIALEYCPGKTIRDYLKNSEKGLLTESETRKILKDVLNGLSFLHNRQIIHHDLKLENFIIGSDGRVKIADFGLATLSKDEENNSSVCGTPNYMSPEIILKNNNGSGFESDVWAIGIAAFTMLTGRAPFSGCTKDAIFENIKKCIFNFPSQIPLSLEAKDFIKSILRYDPLKRPKARDLLRHPFLIKYDSEVVHLYKPLHKVHSCLQYSAVHNNELQPKRTMSSMINNNINMSSKANPSQIPIQPPKMNRYSNLCIPNSSPLLRISEDSDSSLKKSPLNYQCTRENNETNDIISNIKKTFTIPSNFVTKYCFFQNNLCFMMGNGTVGICFEDKTRIVIDPKEEFVQIYSNYNSLDDVIDLDNSLELNEDIQYKVSLVKRYAKSFKKYKQLYELPRYNYLSSIPLYHITYFIKKDNSILFKLNNKNVQVAFNDHNNLIIFWNTKKMCFFKNIKDKCSLLDMNEVSRMNANSDENKRFKKAKEMLNALSRKI